jgi:RNA-directed DNA polymerase
MTIDAVSRSEIDWHAINWQKVHQTVRRLQIRIVKATQEGKWRKVRALQRLLTHSFSGKALAVKRVTENRGKKTPGVDREIWDTPKKKAEAISRLRQGGYKPLPLRRIYIPKSNGKKRPISIPAMLDRAMQSLYLLALDPIAETQADRNSYGFRIGRSTADAIEQCFNVLFRNHAAQWILEADVRSCFDKINHRWLLDNMPMDKAILRKWLKAGFMEGNSFHHTAEGTPQGGTISPALCNLTLDGLEKELATAFAPKTSRQTEKAKVNLIRLADDFVVTGSSKELLEHQCIPLIEEFLESRGLELSQEKTRITHIAEGFDFLGQNIRKYNGKLLIKPSKKNVKTFLSKVRETVKGNKQARTGNLIALLNPLIRGWANYHRHVCSKETYVSIDDAIFRLLWQWSKRRHPCKSRKWIKEKYFKSVNNRNWVFSGKATDGRELQLVRAADVAIKRHIKIRGNVNPYDPKDESYFDKRLKQKWLLGEKGKGKLRFLWLQQEGICPLCRLKITDTDRWELHHIIRRVDGGSDSLANLALLHHNCHQQAHSRGSYVAKPGLARGLREA